MEHLFLMFIDHTQRRNTVGRTPLDEWSARRRDLYLTTHDTHNRQISMPPVGFEPRSQQASGLAFGTQVRGFKPGRSRQIFKGEKILSTPSFGGEVKPSVPCRRFAARKRSLELRGSRILDEICRNILAHEEFHLPLLEVSRVVGREGT